MSQPRRCFHVRDSDTKKRDFLTFKILENDGNGDCLFLSIMQFLQYDENHEIPNNAMDLRQKTVNYISHSTNWNRFVDTITFNLENALPMLQQKDYTDRYKTKMYNNYMSKEYQFGTFAELQAASEMFNFVYVVFRKKSRRSDAGQSSNEGSSETWYNCYSSEDHDLKSKMFLLFSGTPSSGHFQFMKPIFPRNITVIPQGDYKTLDEYKGSDNSVILTVKKITDASSACPLCGNYN